MSDPRSAVAASACPREQRALCERNARENRRKEGEGQAEIGRLALDHSNGTALAVLGSAGRWRALDHEAGVRAASLPRFGLARLPGDLGYLSEGWVADIDGYLGAQTQVRCLCGSVALSFPASSCWPWLAALSLPPTLCTDTRSPATCWRASLAVMFMASACTHNAKTPTSISAVPETNVGELPISSGVAALPLIFEVGYPDPLTGHPTTGPVAHLLAEKIVEGLNLPAKDAHAYVKTMLGGRSSAVAASCPRRRTRTGSSAGRCCTRGSASAIPDLQWLRPVGQ
jgi:hypothetical protein